MDQASAYVRYNASCLAFTRAQAQMHRGREELRRKVNYNVLNERKCMTRTKKVSVKFSLSFAELRMLFDLRLETLFIHQTVRVNQDYLII